MEYSVIMKNFWFIAVFVILIQVLHGDEDTVSRKDVAQIVNPHVISEDAPRGNVSARIISGTETTRGQLPYMAAIYLDERLFCGGSLISQRWVLTSASCAVNITKFTIHLGVQNLYKASEESGRVTIETTKKIVHHAFNATQIAHDIALLNLQQDVPMSQYIQAIALSNDVIDIGSETRISGWGKIYHLSQALNPELRYTDVTVIGNDQCTKTYAPVIREFHLCTQGTGKKGWCNGDTGGPLVDLSTGKQVGIASFLSHLGCESGSPNGYTRISYYTCWIKSNTGICT